MKIPKLTHGLILAIFALILAPSQSIRPIAGIGPEASWQQALAMALQQKLSFGTDFVFNYGPLGFFESGFLPEVVHPGARLLFDLYILCNLLFVIHYAMQKSKKKWLVALLVLAMFLPWGFIADATFTLLFLFLFNLFHANENHRSFSLYNAVFIAALMFFIKLNFSLVISLLLYVSLLYLLVTQRFSWRELLAVIVTHLFLIYWGAYQLHVNIAEYLRSSWHIISQYNESQARIFLSETNFRLVIGFSVLVTLLALVVFFRNVKNVYRQHDYLFTFAMVFAAMYLTVKQQFTILNTANAMAYFLFLPPLLGLLWIFLRDTGQWFSRLTIATLIVSVFVFQWLRYQSSNTGKDYLLSFFPKEKQYFNAKYNAYGQQNRAKEPLIDLLTILKLHSPYGYIKSLTHKNFSTYLPKYNHKNRLLPSSVLNKIGTATVDILPNETSYIFYNKLNYNPRPCIQSRQAVGFYLDSLNAHKFGSISAPQYILNQWKPDGLINPLWQETHTKLAFINNYEKITAASVPQFNSKNVIVNYDTLSVYKRTQSKAYQIGPYRKLNGGFNKEILLPSAGLYILKGRFRNTWAGELAKYFFQAPYLFAKITYTDGSSDQFRVITPLFENGVFINKKVKNNADLDLFYQTMGQKNVSVKSVTIYPKSSWTYHSNFEIELAQIQNP
jgi:hypothetical protein